ncbi:hypothetical protein [Halomonas sp. PR-M31]|uniref:hypothetical protein n=1 Tax=Halomonas sp. PR-M31 TaxID=1471202 RepID=UPI00065086F9|nr:hypothetical protein [Halomonas sp. PR-M31]
MRRIPGAIALLALMTVLLTGCASGQRTLPERQIALEATSEQVLNAGLDALVERGFVIRFANTELGRINAVFAARPGYEVRLTTSTIPAGTRLTLSGHQGGRAIDPQRFDSLLVEITSRIESER